MGGPLPSVPPSLSLRPVRPVRPVLSARGGARCGSHGPVHGVLAGAQVGRGVLHAGVAEARVLLGFQSQAGQARVTCVPVNVRRGGRRVRAGGRGDRGIQRGAAQVVEVVEAVEAGARHPGHGRGHHAGGHAHGRDGVGGREHALRRQGVDVHGVEEGEALGGQGGRREALGGPVVVRVAGVHVVVGLHEAVELRPEAVLAQLRLLVAFALSPFGSAILEPDLGRWRKRGRWGQIDAVRGLAKHLDPGKPPGTSPLPSNPKRAALALRLLLTPALRAHPIPPGVRTW